MFERLHRLVGIVFRANAITCDYRLSPTLEIHAESLVPFVDRCREAFPGLEIHDYGIRKAAGGVPLYWIRFSP